MPLLWAKLPADWQWLTGPVMRVGGGFTAPSVLQKCGPAYTNVAPADKVQGAVVLQVVVGADGVARGIQLVRSLRPDLDQKAIDAVSGGSSNPV